MPCYVQVTGRFLVDRTLKRHDLRVVRQKDGLFRSYIVSEPSLTPPRLSCFELSLSPSSKEETTFNCQAGPKDLPRLELFLSLVLSILSEKLPIYFC